MEGILDKFIEMAKEQDGSEKLQRLLITGVMIIFIIIFIIYAVVKLLGF